MRVCRHLPCLLTALVVLAVGRPLYAQDCPSCQPPYDVTVTPATGVAAHPLGSGVIDSFEVTNTGLNSDTYTYVCSSTGGVSCTSVTPSSSTIGSGSAQYIRVTYALSVPGGTLKFKATGSWDIPAQDSGYYTVSANPTLTIVAPVRTGMRAVVATRQPVIRALFLPNGSPVSGGGTTLIWKHGASTDTVTKFKSGGFSMPRQNHGLIEWEVDSARWLNGRPDSALFTIKACAANGLCTSDSGYAVLPNDSTPIIGFTGRPLEALGREFGSPFGPGLAVSGAEVETGFSIPSYISMGSARSAGLVYSTRQSYPRVLIPVDVEVTWPVGTPDQIKVMLLDGAQKLDSFYVNTPSCATGAARRCRAVLQGDFSGSSISTPTRKWLKVQIQVKSGAITKTITDSTEVVLVDRRVTPYGSGWWPSGFLKIVAAGSDRVLVGPSGTAAIYRGNGDSLYLSPPGDFTALVKTSTGWELQPRGSTAKLVFDSNGRLRAAVDQNGNRDSIAYSGSSDQVTKFVDRVGKTITLAYNSSGKLSTFTDPGGRQSRDSIDASNQLIYDSISSLTSRPYTRRFVYQAYPGYSGTNSFVLTKTVGVILDTTIVTYDSASFRRRPSQVRLPLVKDENGADATPLIKYTAYERRGFGTADTGTFVSLESVYVEIRDPRSFYTRSLLDRWGGARKTWDSLGVIARTQFTADGFVLWAEGKNGDSSRVYNTYDGSWHVTRSYIVRAAADTFRLDSLVYDTNHRVIRRIGASRDTSRYVYDGNGNVTKAISPNNDTTFYTYLSDGRLSAVKLPGNTASRTISYDATWKNPLKRFDESGTMQDSAVFDNLGRDTTHLSKLRVQIATGAATQWQWRWSRTWYNIANEADSSRLLRSVNCADPCTTPPATMADSIRLRHRYDRAGRDSLRINDLGKAVRYGYDRLGRLLSRRPWNDSSAVKDSLLYDVAGNIKKTITRRGEVITVNYDSRNRDTLTVIPGVGTLRRTFGGPLDQLTRLWYDSPVDSIGNVNAELRWGYDQRGRLKADTAYTGTTVRATTYTYDAMERVATRGDPLGTWTTRYETARGFADTLLTPMGDTITYTFDAKSRALGPYIRGGGPLESRVPVWDQTGSLNTLTHSVSTAPSFTALQFDRQVAVDDPQPTEAVLWNEVHGSGASSNFLWDSVTYDGWGRVTSFRALKNGVAVDSESFWFDHNGNIAGSKWGSNYDATTDRLLSRTGDPCGTWNYLYDRAGNDTSAVCGSATWKYSYDALNRLRAVRYNGTLIARYGYDVLGRRIAKRVYSSSSGGVVAYTRFVYSGSAVEFETDSGGVIGLRYTHGPGTDDLLAVRDAAGNHYYIVQDLLRSVRGVVRRDGAWVMSQRFGPYGTVITRDTSTTAVLGFALRYAWTGREYDVETGWYYFRARYFDPNVRRFAQEDPIGYAGGGNVYAYANGNSLEARDPSGLEANYEKMVCHNCGNPLYEQDVYLDGVPFPARWGLDFSGPGFTLNPGLSPWAGLDGARYQRYLVAYERKVQDLVKYFAGVGDKSTALALIYDSHPLGFYGFMNAERAIGILWSEDFGGHLVNSVALTMGQLLEQGAVFFNSVLIQGQKAWSPNLRGQPDGMMSNAFIALRVDGANTAEDIAWTFAHEYGHWITGSNLEGIANGVACAYFFSSSNCHN